MLSGWGDLSTFMLFRTERTFFLVMVSEAASAAWGRCRSQQAARKSSVVRIGEKCSLRAFVESGSFSVYLQVSGISEPVVDGQTFSVFAYL